MAIDPRDIVALILEAIDVAVFPLRAEGIPFLPVVFNEKPECLTVVGVVVAKQDGDSPNAVPMSLPRTKPRRGRFWKEVFVVPMSEPDRGRFLKNMLAYIAMVHSEMGISIPYPIIIPETAPDLSIVLHFHIPTRR